MSVEDLVLRLRVEEDNKLALKDTCTPDSIKANMIEHAGSSSRSNPKGKGKDKRKNDKKSKGKSAYLAPNAGIVKQKFQGTCYNCDQPGHRAANCKMPKRVNLVGINHGGWWIDTGVTRYACADKSMSHSFRAVDNGQKLYMGNSTTADIKVEGDVILKMTSKKDLKLTNVLYVLEIRKNLVSGSLLNKFGFRLVFESDKFVLSKNQIYVGKGYAMNGMFKLNVMVVINEINKMNSSAYLIESSNVWHGRLAHELVELPPGCKLLGYKWIFKKKMKVDGTIDKYKASNDKMIKSTKGMLKSKFDMKDMGLADVILGIKIIRTQNELVLSQAHYVDKILNTHNAGDSSPARTPIDTKFITLDKCGEKAEWLRQFVEDIPRWPKSVTAISIHCDSQLAIGRAQSTMYNGKSRNIRRQHNSIRQLLSTGVISIDCVASKDKIADLFTKGLSREALRSPQRVLHNELKYVQIRVKMNGISCLKMRHVEHKVWELETIPHRPKREMDFHLFYRSETLDHLRNFSGQIVKSGCTTALDVVPWETDGKSVFKFLTFFVYVNIETRIEFIETKIEFQDMQHKRKKMSVEDLVLRLRIEEDNKLAVKDTCTPDSIKANMIEHAGSSSWSNPKGKGKDKRKNDKKSKGKSEYLPLNAGIVKQKFQGTCYNCDQPGHRAANCKMPKRVNPHQANKVNDDVDTIVMVSDMCAMISEVNLVGINHGGWWIDTGATRHACADKSMFHSFSAVDNGQKLYMGNSTTADIKVEGDVILKMTPEKDLKLTNVLYVLEIRKNLVSSWLLNKFGFRLVFESDKFVLSKNQIYVGKGYAISVASNQGWPLHQFDVKNAFLHGELKEVYMEAPPGFSEHFKPREACRLKKSLYGLKQSPRAWFGRFTLAMKRSCLWKKAKLADRNRYQWLVGKLIYLSHTCLDIAHVVGVVSRFMHQPQVAHMNAALRIVRYLKGTAGHGVLFRSNGHLNIQRYTDANWAGDKGNRRSTSGYFSLVGGNLVTWRSKKQKGKEHELPFQTLKDKLCNAHVLALPNGLEDFVRIFSQKELNMQQRHWIELFSDYDCEICYHPGKVNVVVDALSMKERVNPKRDRAMNMTLQTSIKDRILLAQSKAKDESGDVRTLIMDKAHKSKYSVHPGADKMYYDLRDRCWWLGMKKDIDKKCRLLIMWDEVGEGQLIGPELVLKTTENISQIKDRLKPTRDRKKSYADKRRKPLEFSVGDYVLLKVSP
nr:hypothetical protein [Tanacetum cinerariifolium]